MDWQTLIQPKVLIVEDDLTQLRGIERDIKTISVGSLKELGIDSFGFTRARSVEGTESLFPRTGEAPYDLLLLDLGIPETDDELVPEGEQPSRSPESGQTLLEKVQKEGVAKEVIVISVWYIVEQVARAFRSGVIDFIAKPYTRDVLQAKVIECWKRLLGKESARLLGAERIGELVPYAEKGLAYRFSSSFSGLVRAVAHSAEDIEAHVHERYGLDRRKDSQDYFFHWLEGQKRSVEQAKNDWEALQSSLLSPGDSYREARADAILRDVHQSLLPSFIVKNVVLEPSGGSETPVLTFEDDVRAVMKEIVAGALNERADYGAQGQPIAVEIGDVKGQVRVSFTDSQSAISPEAAQKINQGAMLTPRLRFTREWGLSVVQHVAMRGGGRIEVEPRPSGGNVVTYFIPSAN